MRNTRQTVQSNFTDLLNAYMDDDDIGEQLKPELVDVGWEESQRSAGSIVSAASSEFIVYELPRTNTVQSTNSIPSFVNLQKDKIEKIRLPTRKDSIVNLSRHSRVSPPASSPEAIDNTARYQEPVDSFDAAELISRIKLGCSSEKTLVKRLLLKGSALFLLKTPQSLSCALKLWEEAFVNSKKQNDYYQMAMTMNNVSCVHRSRKSFEKALGSSEYAWKSILMAYSVFLRPDEKPTTDCPRLVNIPSSIPLVVAMIEITLNYGNVYFGTGQYDQSIEWYTRTLQLCSQALELWPLPCKLVYLFDECSQGSKATLSEFHLRLLEIRSSALSCLGGCYRKKSDRLHSQSFHLRALACHLIFEHVSHQPRLLESTPVVYGNMALHLYTDCKYPEAQIINAQSTRLYSDQPYNESVGNINQAAIIAAHSRAKQILGSSDNDAMYEPRVQVSAEILIMELSALFPNSPSIHLLRLNEEFTRHNFSTSEPITTQIVEAIDLLKNERDSLSEKSDLMNIVRLNLSSAHLLNRKPEKAAKELANCSVNWQSHFIRHRKLSPEQQKATGAWAHVLFNMCQVLLSQAVLEEEEKPHVRRIRQIVEAVVVDDAHFSPALLSTETAMLSERQEIENESILKALKVCLYTFQNCKYYGLSFKESSWYSLRTKLAMGIGCCIVSDSALDQQTAFEYREEGLWWVVDQGLETLQEYKQCEGLDGLLKLASEFIETDTWQLQLMVCELAAAYRSMDHSVSADQMQQIEKISFNLKNLLMI